jgi:hypothetical protein
MMLQTNPQTTIRDAMAAGLAFQSEAPDCQKISASKPNLAHHYVEEHAEKRMGKLISYIGNYFR